MKLTYLISLVLISLTSHSPTAWAQLPQSVNKPFENANSIRFARPKFPDNGRPTGRRKGGTSRDGCVPLNAPITALVPGEEVANESKSFLTFTISEYPTFWVYVPELPINPRFAEFLLQDEDDKIIFHKSLSLPEKASVIGIKLPKNTQYALKTDQKYQWYFKVFCGDPQKTPDYFYVKAWIQKLPLTINIQNELKITKPKEYITYALNQIWQDALTNLATLRQSDPNSAILAKDWTILLKDVGLEELATVPLIELSITETGTIKSNLYSK